jgi:hypothetical protein
MKKYNKSKKVIPLHATEALNVSARIKDLVYIMKKYNKSKKAIPLHAMEALWLRGSIAPTLYQPQHWKGVSGQHHALAVL